MIGISGIARVLETWPSWRRPRPEAWPDRAADRCPKCGKGRLRLAREVPGAGAPRRHYRCTAPGCAFECVAA